MSEFNPDEHTAPEVHDYLAKTTDVAEYDRVVAAEQARDGGARVTALNGLERPEPLPEGAQAVQTPPSGQWERLLGRDGEPVTDPSGAQVRVR